MKGRGRGLIKENVLEFTSVSRPTFTRDNFEYEAEASPLEPTLTSPRVRLLLEKRIAAQLVEKFHDFYKHFIV
jgi:hypothetical protein